MNPVYLIGGGEITNHETLQIDEMIARDGVPGSTLAFFGTAAGDSPKYTESIALAYPAYKVVAITSEMGREHAIDKLAEASIIYFGGGTTSLLVDQVETWQLLPFLVKAHQRGAVLAGISAGAQALSCKYVHEDVHGLEIRDGWGFVPVTVLVHADEKKVNEANQFLIDDIPLTAPLIGISNSAAIRFTTSGKRVCGNGTIFE